MAVTVGVRLPDNTIKTIEKLSKEEGADKSTVLRKAIEKGLKDWMLEKALALYRDGKVSLWKASEIAGISLRKMIDVLEEKNIRYNYDIDSLAEYIKKKYGKVI